MPPVSAARQPVRHPLWRPFLVPVLVAAIATIASHPLVTHGNSWTYRICANDAQVGVAMARYAVDAWGKRRLAIFYVNDDYGRGIAEVFRSEVERRGATVLASTFHRNRLTESDELHIRSVLERIRPDEPDLLVLFQRPDAGRRTIAAAQALGMRADVLGGDNLSHPFMLVDSAAHEGLRSVQFLAPQSDDPRFARRNELKSPDGTDAGYSAAFAYDALYLVRDAVLAGGFTREGVHEALTAFGQSGTLHHGITGDYRLNADRDADRAVYIVETRGGTHHYLARLDPE